MNKLFTLGYEGLDVDTFIDRLLDVHVKRVVDVRELPLSRKKGFSKRALSDALECVGIRYVHIRELGCPKEVRDQYKKDRNWQSYVRGYRAHLAHQKSVVKELAATAKSEATCLVCFEADYNFCHRSLITNEVTRQAGARVDHLTSKRGSVDCHFLRAA